MAMKQMSRRTFNKTLALTGAVSALSATRVLGANERIRLGIIGLGNRGDQVLDAFLAQGDAEVAALCDIYDPYLDFAAGKVGGQPRRFKDYRALLELEDLDAVVINTPDHWHALQTIHACQAGKDIYVEKPLSLRVSEGRRMIEAVKHYRRVCQVGIHRRSIPICREAAELVRSGVLGKITAARSFHIQNEWPEGIANPQESTPPEGLDWEAWLGPAPWKPYNKNHTFYRFRWFYDYSGGQLTNFGVHYIDFIHACLGHDAPRTVTALGGRFAAMNDNREIPDTLEVIWEYPDATLVTFTQLNATAAPWSLPGCEVELRGTLGTLYLFGNGYEIVGDSLASNPFPARTPIDRAYERRYRQGAKSAIESRQHRGVSTSDTRPHARDFLDCIKSRRQPSCDIETGHRSTSATLIANIAHQTRQVLDWDARKERFSNHEPANRLLEFDYRTPYTLPRIG
jgi:predicted dehydrogenase